MGELDRAHFSEELVLDTDIGRSAFGDSYTLNKPEIKTEYIIASVGRLIMSSIISPTIPAINEYNEPFIISSPSLPFA